MAVVVLVVIVVVVAGDEFNCLKWGSCSRFRHCILFIYLLMCYMVYTHSVVKCNSEKSLAE